MSNESPQRREAIRVRPRQLNPIVLVLRFDPGLGKMREAAVTMLGALGSFGTAFAIKQTAPLPTSVTILSVALALSLGRQEQRMARDGRLLALLVLPLVAVIASEISTQIFARPELGDMLFVLAISATIWARRFGPCVRQAAAIATVPLIAMLIVPAPAAGTPEADHVWWWAALIAVIVVGWVTIAHWVAVHTRFLELATGPKPQPQRPAKPPRRHGHRIGASSRMSLQMGVALATAFAAGRGLFGTHWMWVVLTAFIVSSGNRGRGDVAHKAVLRVVGAGVGTLAATVLTGAFAPGNEWSIVIIFVALGIALWLRGINYAYWAAGVTAALALLYGYYGQRGIDLLATRLEAILVGAALGVAVSWFLLPVRSTDVIRRDIALALAALADYLASLKNSNAARTSTTQQRVLDAVSTLDHSNAVPRSVRACLGCHPIYIPAVNALKRSASELPGITAALSERENNGNWGYHLDGLQAAINELRQATAQHVLPGAPVWNSLANAIAELPLKLDQTAAPQVSRNPTLPARATNHSVAP